MPKNIFKIYDGRTSFWQWDTGQKLIVLDESITEVHFSHRDMKHAECEKVYVDYDTGLRVVNIPDLLLQLPKILIAYVYEKDENGINKTLKSVRFAVNKCKIPADYICDQDKTMDSIVAGAGLNAVDNGTETVVEVDKNVTWVFDCGNSMI